MLIDLLSKLTVISCFFLFFNKDVIKKKICYHIYKSNSFRREIHIYFPILQIFAFYKVKEAERKINQRLPGACNRSPGSKLLSITTQLHCGGHLGGRAQLPDTILEEDHPMTIPSKFGFNWATGSRQDGFYVNFP